MELPESVARYLDWTLLGNGGETWLLALAIFVGAFVVLEIFRSYILHVLARVAKKTRTHWDDIIVEALQGSTWRMYFYISLYAALQVLEFPPLAERIIAGIIFILIVYYVVKIIHQFVGLSVEAEAKRRRKEAGNDVSFVKVLGRIGQGTLWVIAALLVLANFGVEITPLIASLGVGGIAIAFALQNILEDLFSSFSIYFDKPFRVGDFIIIQNDMGTVEHIGLKTTRVRTLQGQELVVSNRELTSTRVNNYKRMDERRIAFSFGVTYDTSAAKLEKANQIVEQVVSSVEGCRLDRTHFKEFGDFALLFEVVYYLSTSDYNAYMDAQQAINLGIKKEFEKAKIEMAFPTQTVYVKSA